MQEQQQEEEVLGCLTPSHDHVLDFTSAAVVDRKLICLHANYQWTCIYLQVWAADSFNGTKSAHGMHSMVETRVGGTRLQSLWWGPWDELRGLSQTLVRFCLVEAFEECFVSVSFLLILLWTLGLLCVRFWSSTKGVTYEDMIRGRRFPTVVSRLLTHATDVVGALCCS